MTRNIFKEWLKTWDEELDEQNRDILLWLDNVDSHHVESENFKLKRIKIRYLMPNTTSVAQPMDQGIIATLKRYYKKILLRDKVANIEYGYDTDINILDAMRMLERAWEYVTPDTIKNCFAKAKFFDDLDREVFICILVNYLV